MVKKIAIIGGGISGVTLSIKLSKNEDNEIHLFEKRNKLLKGPPYCHLHAGGFLYPEISVKDGQELLQDSINFAKEFKDCLEFRPTIIAYRTESEFSTQKLIFKCKVNKMCYNFSKIKSLGNCEDLFAIYTKQDMIYYKKNGKLPSSTDMGREYHDKYVENFCKIIDDIEIIKYPFVSVCEYGINQNKVEEILLKKLNKCSNVKINLNTIVFKEDLNKYDQIINASGRDILNNNSDIYELKSSWEIISNLNIYNFPEIAIIGERCTDKGMLQISPKENGLFQIHNMTKDASIIKSFDNKSIKNVYIDEKDIELRGNNAILQLSKTFSIFKNSKLKNSSYGIQRISCNDYSKRISYIKIYNKRFIDVYTLKACSIITLSNKVENLMNN